MFENMLQLSKHQTFGGQVSPCMAAHTVSLIGMKPYIDYNSLQVRTPVKIPHIATIMNLYKLVPIVYLLAPMIPCSVLKNNHEIKIRNVGASTDHKFQLPGLRVSPVPSHFAH